MADVFLFIQHGWKNIWRQKIIWLYSIPPILDQLFNILPVKRAAAPLSSFIFMVESIIFVVLSYVGMIGVPYLAYRFLIGKPATIKETSFAVNKFSGRIIGCSCLGLLVMSPFLFWALAVSMNISTHTFQFTYKAILIILPLSIFTALWQFTLVTFFENDWGIRQGLDKAWNLFKSHFGVLAILGLTLTTALRAYSAMSGILTVLIQSGIDINSISGLDLFNPYASLSKSLLFVLINGIGQTILTPLSASIFISAYLKYSDAKLPFEMRVRW